MNLPPYPVFPEITSDIIVLRQIQAEDIIHIVDISFYNAQPAVNLEEALHMQQQINNDYLNGNSIHWGIANSITNEIIGTCGYYRGLDMGTGELGCVLKKDFRGKGYMTLAMKLVIEFGLNIIQLNNILAQTSIENNKAIMLLERLNFKKIRELSSGEVEYQL